MNNILVVAKNTFRETIRDKILYGILGFGILYILLDLFMAKLSLGDVFMIKIFGLAGIYIFGLVITIFLGASIIYKEIERRTLYFILSKPVSRLQVILGKFTGLFAAVVLTTLLMSVVYLVVIINQGGGFDGLGLLAIFLQLLEMGLLIALLIFFSTLTTPLTATLSATILLFVGHLLNTVLENSKQMSFTTNLFVKVAYYVLPNLEKFNIRGLVAHNIAPSGGSLLATLLYAIVYTALLLEGAHLLLKKREL